MESGRNNAKVVINGLEGVGDTVAGMSNWEYSGENREMIEAPETFDAEYIERLPGIIKGGDIEVSGVLKPGDSGLTALQTAFENGTTFGEDELALYVATGSGGAYYTPDSSSSPASSAFVSKAPTGVTHEASGVAQVSFTIAVSGQLVKKDIA